MVVCPISDSFLVTESQLGIAALDRLSAGRISPINSFPFGLSWSTRQGKSVWNHDAESLTRHIIVCSVVVNSTALCSVLSRK